jgi:hypothetical protein
MGELTDTDRVSMLDCSVLWSLTFKFMMTAMEKFPGPSHVEYISGLRRFPWFYLVAPSRGKSFKLRSSDPD